MDNHEEQPSWKPVQKTLRRVAGVLVEKAKTTPDSYPLTLNAITTGSNQKSNRSPQMQLNHDDVQEALDELREMGAVTEYHSDGRKPKFKHRLYEWLGVDKIEMAVMAELLLRGAQTLGDLRARASRMETIESQAELKPIVGRLLERGLMIELTPPGRGQLVTHSLYMPEELAKVERELKSGVSAPTEKPAPASTSPQPELHSNLEQRLDELTQQVEILTKKVEEISQQLQ